MIASLGALATTLSQSPEASLAVKVTLVSLGGLAAFALARRSRASIRHMTLAATVVAMLAVPAASVVLPAAAIFVPTPPRAAAAAVAPIDTPVSPSVPAVTPLAATATGRNWPSLIAVVRTLWLAGATGLLLSLGLQLWRLRQLRAQGVPWLEGRALIASLGAGRDLSRRVDVLLHEQVQAPLTCGIVRPVILLPVDVSAWSPSAVRRALIHELEHVRRHDWLGHLTSRVARAVYWFHPLVWVVDRRLSLEAERACDDGVLEREDGVDYAQQLVGLARQMAAGSAAAALGMAHRSDLSVRVSSVLDARQPRGRAGWPRAVIAAAVATAIVAGVAPLRAVRAPNASSVSGASVADAEQRRDRVNRLDKALVEAAADGDAADVADLIRAGANINAAVDGDGSPLIAAARAGHLDIVTSLLDQGADVNLSVRGDGNPLIMAAREGHLAIVRLLLGRGASVDQVVPDDENALIQASGEGHLDVVRLLVAQGADVNARVWAEGGVEHPGEWRTPLSVARRENHRAVVEFLLSRGARE